MNRNPIDELLRAAEPRTLGLAFGALLLIGVLAGFVYGIKPAWTRYGDLKQARQFALDAALTSAVDEASSITRLHGQVDSLRNRLYGGAAGIPVRQIESFVVDSLDRISGRHGVDLLGITPDRPTSAWLFEEMPYEVRVQGSYFSIYRWLHDVEEELRPMVIKQFELSPSRDASAVILDLRVVAYRAAEASST